MRRSCGLDLRARVTPVSGGAIQEDAHGDRSIGWALSGGSIDEDSDHRAPRRAPPTCLSIHLAQKILWY
jgi:hypothetical protein